MEASSFFGSLFDFSFSRFVTTKIIRVLYILSTILIALWTLIIVLAAFRSSTGAGILTLIIGGPLIFLISLIYVRVILELIMVIFRIHEDVKEINVRGGGTGSGGTAVAETYTSAPASVYQPPAESEPTRAEESGERFCASCGAERSPGKSFCTSCGSAYA